MGAESSFVAKIVLKQINKKKKEFISTNKAGCYFEPRKDDMKYSYSNRKTRTKASMMKTESFYQ